MQYAQLSRYPIQPLNDGVFFFVTDLGNYFTVTFRKNTCHFTGSSLLFNNGNIIETSIEQTVEKKGGDKIATDTILSILITNILASGDTSIFYYVCDSLNGKGAARSRLFDIWYLLIVKYIPNLRKYNFELPSEGEAYYITLLIFENHPHHINYIKEFKDNLDNNFGKNSL